jgi:hypothetical protein
MFARAGLAEVAIDEHAGRRRNDHILYRGLALKSKRIATALSAWMPDARQQSRQ